MPLVRLGFGRFRPSQALLLVLYALQLGIPRHYQHFISKLPWIQLSSDSDVYGSEYRSDDHCHINEIDGAHVGSDYFELILKAMT